jgi:hypothetical protein
MLLETGGEGIVPPNTATIGITTGAKGLRRFGARKTAHYLVIYMDGPRLCGLFYWVELAYHPRVTSARIFSPTFLSPRSFFVSFPTTILTTLTAFR